MNRIVKHVGGLRTLVLIVTPDIKIGSQARLISQVQARGVAVIAVLVGYPDIAPKLGSAETIVFAYCKPEQTEIAMRAVADVLVGQGPIGIAPLLEEIKMTVGKPENFNALDILRAPAGMLPVTIEPPFVAGLSVPYDPTFSLKKTLWEFGDGGTSKDLHAEHTFQSAGRYPITLTVRDKKDHTTSRTFYAVVE
ncbi:MAG: PKD domain-containing protein [Candidatus Hydrogenedentes bacterium]|nr:PKD domain-containing protein [Candidatus Hydrogenedentota bacterium]